MDDLTPMDPSFRELPPEQPEQMPDHYGTGRQPMRTKSHIPLIVALLALLLSANVLTCAALVRLWRDGEKTGTNAPSGERVNPLSVLPEQPSGDLVQDEDSALQISGYAERLPLTEIYQKVAPSLTVVTAQTGGETQSGTGVLLTSDGYLLTNAHIVSGAQELTVTLSDGTGCAASYVGLDTASDLAVLKIEAEGLTAAEFGDSDLVSAGDAVVAFGNPFGEQMSGTMTEGIISAVNENVTVGGVQTRIFQTNVTLLSEDTGGLLVNAGGQVIAVGLREVAGYVSYESVSGIGFALPAREVLSVANDLIAYGCVSERPSLGMKVDELDEPQRIYWALPEGVLVTRIERDSNAYRMGLRAGDILLYLDQTPIPDVASYYDALNRYSAGDTVRILLYRGGTKYYADVVLNEAGD